MAKIIVDARKVRVTGSEASSAQVRSAAKVRSSATMAPPSSAGIAKCSFPIPNAGRLNSSASPRLRGEPSA